MARSKIFALVTFLSFPALAGAGEPPAEVPLSRSTHNWLAPSGETLAEGEAQLSFHEFVYGELAYGVTDRLEISMTLPVVPVFGSFGARYSVLSRESPLRLVVGGSAWWGSDVFDTGGNEIIAVFGTATLAYQTERFNLHVTGSFAPQLDDEDDGDAVGITNVGLTVRIGARAALMIEMAELVAGDRKHAERAMVTAAGFKWLRQEGAIDLGLAYVHGDEDDDGAIFPVLSVTQRY